MLVDCPDCSRSYHLTAGDIGESGRLLICPRCDARWFQQGIRPAELDAGRQSPHGMSGQGPIATDRLAPPKPAGLSVRAGRLPRGFQHARALIALALVTIVVIGGVGKRASIVLTMPRTSALYRAVGLHVNVRGLEFMKIAAKDEASGDVTIAGEIHNVAGRRVRIPRLAFEVRDRDGAALMSWSQTSPANTLPVGRTIAFASAPHRMPAEGRSILVRFDSGDPLPTGIAGRGP